MCGMSRPTFFETVLSAHFHNDQGMARLLSIKGHQFCARILCTLKHAAVSRFVHLEEKTIDEAEMPGDMFQRK